MRPRVAYVGSIRGGHGPFTYHLVRGLSKNFDFEVYLLTYPNDYVDRELIRRIHQLGIKIQFISLSPLREPVRVADWSKLWHGRYDLVHFSYAAPAFVFGISSRIPIIYTNHAFIQPSYESLSLSKLLQYKIEYAMLRLVSKRASCVATVSEYCKDRLRSEYGINSLLIYHGVEDSFLNNEVPKQTAKERLGLDPSRRYVLYSGRVHASKRIDDLFRAFSLLCSDYGDLDLVVTTTGIDSPHYWVSLMKIASSLGFSSRVHRLRVPEANMPLIYRSSEVTVLPSMGEGFGMAMTESMAAGTPVIGSDNAAIPEVIGGAGLVFRAGDVRTLSLQLRSVLSSPSVAQEMSRKGVERVRAKFEWSKSTGKYESLYDALIKRS
jgi:glycosyltransferase involved in cell wall biosynthesis